jgi:DNA-binding transcriptional regulator of glucitol operon
MNVIVDNFVTILLGLVVMWLLQFGLAYWQMRRFYRRMSILRQGGLTAIGLSGNRYKGRTYAVLTIDEDNRIVHAEKFSGWTIFAGLKPVPELVGLPLDEMLAKQTTLPVGKKLQLAFANAARDLQAARQKKLDLTLEPAYYLNPEFSNERINPLI